MAQALIIDKYEVVCCKKRICLHTISCWWKNTHTKFDKDDDEMGDGGTVVQWQQRQYYKFMWTNIKHVGRPLRFFCQQRQQHKVGICHWASNGEARSHSQGQTHKNELETKQAKNEWWRGAQHIAALINSLIVGNRIRASDWVKSINANKNEWEKLGWEKSIHSFRCIHSLCAAWMSNETNEMSEYRKRIKKLLNHIKFQQHRRWRWRTTKWSVVFGWIYELLFHKASNLCTMSLILLLMLLLLLSEWKMNEWEKGVF